MPKRAENAKVTIQGIGSFGADHEAVRVEMLYVGLGTYTVKFVSFLS